MYVEMMWTYSLGLMTEHVVLLPAVPSAAQQMVGEVGQSLLISNGKHSLKYCACSYADMGHS